MTPLSRRAALAGLAAFGALARPASLFAQGAPPTVSTLLELRQRDPAGVQAPVFVQGALAPDDHGGGWFVWRAGSMTDDDGGCVVALANGMPGRWHRLYSGPIDVRWFGARGDGKTDDIQHLQRAVAHHSDIYFPAGIYRLSRPLDLTDVWGRRITGAGQTADPRNPGGFESGKLSRATTLLLDADNAPVLRLGGSGHTIERLCLMAKNRQPRGAAWSYGIELNNVSRSRLSDLRIFNCATGIGLPQRPALGAESANFLFDTALANIDINDFAYCGLDLRNYEGGGTGVLISQIYMNNLAGGTIAQPQLADAEHFILGQNWAEYVLQAIHCEWTRIRDEPILLHNCNAVIQGLHVEGVRFAEDVEAVIRLEGGTTGLTLDAVQLYDCRIEGGPSAPPLALLATSSKLARAELRRIVFARSLRNTAGRKVTTARIIGGDAKVEVSGVMQESDIYAAPIAARGLTQRD
ncbi:MAG TPA: glycosyl hydrolase family 28-related protein [Alphaproteobacteria bacterium]|nr:glycosyl hydrolase family 28-related protein [Alphaproteobacteria bacterium]